MGDDQLQVGVADSFAACDPAGPEAGHVPGLERDRLPKVRLLELRNAYHSRVAAVDRSAVGSHAWVRDSLGSGDAVRRHRAHRDDHAGMEGTHWITLAIRAVTRVTRLCQGVTRRH